MARNALQDYLQDHAFWLMDVAPIEALALPVLSPIFGFNSISAPEITAETTEIDESTLDYTRKVVTGATVGSITMTRGATFFDSDFWRWVHAAVSGDVDNFQSRGFGVSTTLALGAEGGPGGIAANTLGAAAGLFGAPRIGGPSPRRDMVLIQHFLHTGLDQAVGRGLSATLEQTLGNLSVSPATGFFSVAGNVATGGSPGVTKVGAEIGRLPARAWVLKGCIPTRYKVGSDFDATSGQVSMMELEMEVEIVDEVSLAG